ncbi:MAG: Thiamin-phosphate pyrophosphorylase (EC [uncultured Sulfurovum sp.]|uniref:Thiamine-phosphate synthase n=1 Tax=uncultured Sulfurovum sp. TaxID=269237 RepID=A0A6S6S3F9_9BACT|nr:MAG: Thiamin-phosphate pyrophosphorylase (EC [uncultured Sulfurovum sp.]
MEVVLSSNRLDGIYIISDDRLTPQQTIIKQITQALKGGANIVQLRNKKGSLQEIKALSISIQKLCHEYKALFVLNDKIELAIELKVDGLHIGKSDYHRFDEIRQNFKGIIGVSCYNSIEMALEFEVKGADYVAFGSFFTSPTKPDSNVIALTILQEAKEKLNIPICAIGGINLANANQVMRYKPDMVAVISDIWSSNDIKQQATNYTKLF